MSAGPHVIALWDGGARCDSRVCLACAVEADVATMREPELRAQAAADREALGAARRRIAELEDMARGEAAR